MKPILRIILLLALCVIPITVYAKVPELEFNLDSGFYEAPQMLEILCDQQNAKIYYTLDGSVPDENSFVYDGAVELGYSNEREDVLTKIAEITSDEKYVPEMDFPTGHVVRAVAISSKGERSGVVSGTYLVGYDRNELYGDTPVMFLVTDPANLFDYETGIYVLGSVYDEYLAEQAMGNTAAKIAANYTQRGKEWERPVTVTYLPAEGEGFVQDMGVRIKGENSRRRAQKSLRLIARDMYGEKNVKYKLFPDNVREEDGKIVNKYKSFTLRNGGNDANRAKIRDPFIANLATGLRFETANNLPCIAFLNGEYWGIYTLNEEYSDKYIQYHYGIEDDNVITLKNGEIEDGETTDKSYYREMFNYIVDNDMSDSACYQKAASMLDMGSFADYCALQLYIYNTDGPWHKNNWQMWRVRDVDARTSEYADGKWRMMLFDTDSSSGAYSKGKGATEDNITPLITKDDYTGSIPPRMFNALLKSEEFKREFIRACCDVRNLYFSRKRMKLTYDEMKAQYQPYAPDTIRRFGPWWNVETADSIYNTELGYLEYFFTARYDAFLPLVQNAFSLGESCAVAVQVSNPAGGQVYFNERTVPAEAGMEYLYFTECGLTAVAVPAEGARFAGWTVSGDAVIADPEALTTEITFSGAFTLTAHFD